MFYFWWFHTPNSALEQCCSDLWQGVSHLACSKITWRACWDSLLGPLFPKYLIRRRWWGLRIPVSNKFSDAADAAFWEPYFENHYLIVLLKYFLASLQELWMKSNPVMLFQTERLKPYVGAGFLPEHFGSIFGILSALPIWTFIQ